MQKFLIIVILSFSLSTNNAVEGLKCRSGLSDGKTGNFSDTTCDEPEDECVEVLFEEHRCQIVGSVTTDTWTINVAKGCARTCNDLVKKIHDNFPVRQSCKVANCSQCKDDFCNRKFADDNKSKCHEKVEFASGEKTSWGVQSECEKCYKAIFSEPCNHGFFAGNVTMKMGCLRDGRTCNNVVTRIYPCCKVAECRECQNDFCNDDEQISTTTTKNGPTTQQSDLCNGIGALKFATPLGIILALGILTIHLLLP